VEAFIRVENLSLVYNAETDHAVVALTGIDLEIVRGEYLVVLGHNGSGKSTLAKCLNGLLLPTEGEVWVEGQNTRDPEHVVSIRATVGIVFQNPDNQFVNTVVQDEVAFGPENLGVPKEALRQRVRRALEATGLWPSRHQDPRNLSAGQKARLAIASVLAMEPDCLILDESTALLDPVSRRQILALLRDLHQQGLTIVAITHFMDEAPHADRVLVLDEGQVALCGDPRAVFSQWRRLQELGLDLPSAAAIAHGLEQRGAYLGPDILTADELVSALHPWSESAS
jgi:energy-coupling factor transporter ATPase